MFVDIKKSGTNQYLQSSKAQNSRKVVKRVVSTIG